MIKFMMLMVEQGVRYGNKLVQEILTMRQENGKPMSQYRLAQVLSVTDQAVYKWVKGISSPTRKNFDKMLQYQNYLIQINRIRPFSR